MVYLGYKNDVSFLLDWVLCLVEQQSTWNPNIPLRGVLYFARLYREFVAKNQYDLYGTTQIPVPFPQYIVFYNGTRKRPEREVLRLSDAFLKPVHLAEEFAAPALECCALVLDINYGKNQELLEKCKPLLDYSRFIHYIRENIKQGLSAENAVDEAVTRCLKEDILTDVLTAHRREVVGMFLEEYDEELHNRTLRKEGHEDGIADLNTLAQKMIADNRVEELLCSFTDKQLQKDFLRNTIYNAAG